MSEYKSFAQNGGFGPTFGSTNQHAYEEKVGDYSVPPGYSEDRIRRTLLVGHGKEKKELFQSGAGE